MEPLPHLLACPCVVSAPGLPHRLTPGSGTLCVFGWRLCRQDRNNREFTTQYRRRKKWKVTICLLASIVKGATTSRHLANTWVATVLDEPTQAHQVKCVGARTVLLGVLKCVGVYSEQVSFAIGRVTVLALQHGIEHSRAILVTGERKCAATTTCRRYVGWSLHKRPERRLTREDCRDIGGHKQGAKCAYIFSNRPSVTSPWVTFWPR